MSESHVCPGTDDDGRPLQPKRVTCGICDRSWCERCDPGPSALCPYCHGRGHSTAPLPKEGKTNMSKLRTLGSYFRKIDRAGDLEIDTDTCTVWTLTDDRPEWLKDAIYEVHVSDLPNDWVYAECKVACDAIDDETLTDDDSVHEYADGRVDIYTRDLFQWQADMCLTDTYAHAESEANDVGVPDGADMVTRVSVIQYYAISSIANAMLVAWKEAQEDAEDEEEEEAVHG